MKISDEDLEAAIAASKTRLGRPLGIRAAIETDRPRFMAKLIESAGDLKIDHGNDSIGRPMQTPLSEWLLRRMEEME